MPPSAEDCKNNRNDSFEDPPSLPSRKRFLPCYVVPDKNLQKVCRNSPDVLADFHRALMGHGIRRTRFWNEIVDWGGGGGGMSKQQKIQRQQAFTLYWNRGNSYNHPTFSSRNTFHFTFHFLLKESSDRNNGNTARKGRRGKRSSHEPHRSEGVSPKYDLLALLLLWRNLTVFRMRQREYIHPMQCTNSLSTWQVFTQLK